MGMDISRDGTRVKDRPFVVEFMRDSNTGLGKLPDYSGLVKTRFN